MVVVHVLFGLCDPQQSVPVWWSWRSASKPSTPALAPIVLLGELVPGKGRGKKGKGVACAQMLHNTDLV